MTEKIAKRVARRYLAILKDKDLMSDTGGVSKSRLREPGEKPPRDDLKKRYRTKRKTKDEKDKDTDLDKDMKANRRSNRMASRRSQAQDSEENPAGTALRMVDQAADDLIDILETFDKNIPIIQGTTAEERKALTEMKDILETALTPYTVDFIKQLDKFG